MAKKAIPVFGDLVQQVINRRTPAKQTQMDIIEFVESPWGLNFQLYPVQRIVLKCLYGIALDTNPYHFDLSKQVSELHPEYSSLADQKTGYYKYRVVVTDWQKNNPQYMTEAQYLEHLYSCGRSNIRTVTPGDERHKLILSLGRRSGKTLVTSCIAAYEIYRLLLLKNPQTYYGMKDGAAIGLTTVATGREQAGLLYRELNNHFGRCNFFYPYLTHSTASYARFQTPRDVETFGDYKATKSGNPSVRVAFNSCVAKSVRGAANIVVIMDEVAFFGDSGQSSADEIWDAAVPSTATFTPKDPTTGVALKEISDAKIILISSPMGKQGLFYKMFQRGYAATPDAQDMVCIEAPTWEVNPEVPAGVFIQSYHKDPAVFFTEFGARFTDRTRGWIDVAEDLFSCIDPAARPLAYGMPRQRYYLGLDVALRGDGSAVAITHVEDGKVVLDYIEWIKAGEGKFENVDTLQFDDVADWISELSRKFYIVEGIFDQHIGIVLEQALTKRGLSQIKMKPSTPAVNSEFFQNFKNMMWDKRLVLYDYPHAEGQEHSGYILELLELQAEIKTKYRTDVEAPNMDGKHDDRADALVRSVWLATQHAMQTPLYSGVRSNMPNAPQHHNIALARQRAMQSGSHVQRQMPVAGRPGWGNPMTRVPGMMPGRGLRR